MCRCRWFYSLVVCVSHYKTGEAEEKIYCQVGVPDEAIVGIRGHDFHEVENYDCYGGDASEAVEDLEMLFGVEEGRRVLCFVHPDLIRPEK